MTFPSAERILARWRLLWEERAIIANLVGQELLDVLFPAGQDGTEELRLIGMTVQERSEDPITPTQLFEAIQERIINPEPPETDGYLRVMSAFKAKGLTVRLTVLAGAVETWIPSIDPNLSGDEARRELEEQRRLFYVGMTRPTDALVVSSFASMPSSIMYGTQAQARIRRRGRGFGLASRFIREMGATAPATILGDRLLEEFAEVSHVA